MLFLSLALSFVLIAMIVLVLRKQQQRRHQDLADREQTLPPLNVGTDTPDIAADYRPEEAAPAPKFVVTDEPAVEISADVARDWKEECKELRQARQFESALSSAQKAWPQSQSYEQSAITIRAAIKQAQQSNPRAVEQWLSALYRTAAEASLLYDRIPGEPDLRWQTVARLYSRDAISQIELPWHEIGADELKLLTKTDRRQMAEAWGSPDRHISAKTYHKLNFDS